MQINNSLREALETILNLAYEVQDLNSEDGPKTSVPAQYVIDVAKSALSEPTRNCDVGTADEQYGRYIKFCNRRRLMKSDCDMDCPCAAKNFNDHFCQLEWAQMPYEEKGDADGGK